MRPLESEEGNVPLMRHRVSEQVFDSLMRGILRGELKPGEALGNQRELARQLGVSPLLVRQAIHRIEELGLVRVRQGSTTIVLDPNESTDIRVLQYKVEVAATDPKLVTSVFEAQVLTGLPLLVLAERRLTEAELQKLTQLTESLQADTELQAVEAFLFEYWGVIAEATRNPYFQHHLRWWWSLALKLRGHGRSVAVPISPATMRHNYRGLTRALRTRSGTLSSYLEAIEPLLAALDLARSASGLPAPRPRRTTKPKRRSASRK